VAWLLSGNVLNMQISPCFINFLNLNVVKESCVFVFIVTIASVTGFI
jgi:hypothetical protein